MSYYTQDRYGGCIVKYAPPKDSRPLSGMNQWWPDFGPSSKDFSHQTKGHPAQRQFEVMEREHRSRSHSASEVQTMAQFRHPAPSQEALVSQGPPTLEHKLCAHEVTERQVSLRRAEVRQRKMDSWLESAPIYKRKADEDDSKVGRRSLPILDAHSASQVSKETYERHGYIVDRGKGQIADGYSGASTRKANPLRLTAMLFSREAPLSKGGLRSLKRLHAKPWLNLPENRFVYDPTTFLPVPRGGWASLPPEQWPEVEGDGRRVIVSPVTFDKTISQPFVTRSQKDFGSSARSEPALGQASAPS